jgi:hypothetical protein
MSVARSRHTYFAAKFRRVASRRGPIKALVALEHAMLVAIWNMRSTGACYADPGEDFFTRLHPDRAKQRALEQLRRTGYTVMLEPLTAAG